MKFNWTKIKTDYALGLRRFTDLRFVDKYICHHSPEFDRAWESPALRKWIKSLASKFLEEYPSIVDTVSYDSAPPGHGAGRYLTLFTWDASGETRCEFLDWCIEHDWQPTREDMVPKRVRDARKYWEDLTPLDLLGSYRRDQNKEWTPFRGTFNQWIYTKAEESAYEEAHDL